MYHPPSPHTGTWLTRPDAVSCALCSARGIVLALVVALDPAVARGVHAWRRRRDELDEAEEVRFTLAAGIIGVQSEIIRFVEELGLYPRGDEEEEEEGGGIS